VVYIVDTLVKRNIRFVALKETIRFEGKQTMQTKVIVALFGLFAEVERDLMSERTREGLIAAKAKGKLLGRPRGSLGRSKLDGKELEIQTLLDKKVSKASIAKIMGVNLLLVLGRMIAFADTDLADEPDQPAGSLQRQIYPLDGSTPRYREAIRGLNDLSDTLKQAQREQKTMDKEVQSIRSTLEKLQSVRL
jgi:hypothetical protein